MSDIVKDLIRVRLSSGEVVHVRVIEFVGDHPTMWVYHRDGSPFSMGHFMSGGYQRRVARGLVVDTEPEE